MVRGVDWVREGTGKWIRGPDLWVIKSRVYELRGAGRDINSGFLL